MAVAEQAFEAILTSPGDYPTFSRGRLSVLARNYDEKMRLSGWMVGIGNGIKNLSSYGGCLAAVGLLFMYGPDTTAVLPPATSALISIGAGWILEHAGKDLYWRSARMQRKYERELWERTAIRDCQAGLL